MECAHPLGRVTVSQPLFPSPESYTSKHLAEKILTLLVLGEPRGMRPLVAHCHLGPGDLYRRTSQVEQAQEHLTTAATMYREMDMWIWLQKVVAEMEEPA
jgi:hypothetical protein